MNPRYRFLGHYRTTADSPWLPLPLFRQLTLTSISPSPHQCFGAAPERTPDCGSPFIAVAPVMAVPDVACEIGRSLFPTPGFAHHPTTKHARMRTCTHMHAHRFTAAFHIPRTCEPVPSSQEIVSSSDSYFTVKC